MKTSKKIKFYYDVVSPYSFFAFESLMRYKKIWKTEIELVPGFLGGVMKLSSNQPPATNPLKGKYLINDLKLLTKFFKVDLKVPSTFPTMTLQNQRILTAIKMREKEEVLEEVSRNFWKAYFQEDKDISKPEVIREVLEKTFSKEEAEKYIQMSNEAEVKQKLTDVTTDLVQNKGIFGFPSYSIQKEGEKEIILFGSDRMDVLAWIIEEKYDGPVPNISKL